MTRSAQSPFSPKLAKKALRAKAKQDGVTFKAAIEARNKLPEGQKFPSPVGIVRRNPGRMDGMIWNGSAFICVQKVDGLDDGTSDVEEDYTADYEPTPFQERGNRLLTVSLLDIARPAKRKGVAKDFEIVESIPRVIVLEDEDGPEDEFEHWSDDEEWGEAYDSEGGKERKSYSAILKGDDDK